MSKKVLFSSLVVFFCLSGQICQGTELLMSRTQVIMGTYFTLTLPQRHQALFDEAFGKAKEVDELLSTYKEESEVSRLNRSKTFEVSPLVEEVLRYSLNLREKTDGQFDVTVGRLTEGVYGFGRDKRTDVRNRTSDLVAIGPKEKSIDIQKNKVKLSANTRLDFGGIGKGFAVDKVRKFLEDKSINRGEIGASGDIGCLGACKIGIRDPFNSDPNGIFLEFQLRGSKNSVSTSGTYENVLKDGAHHLLNPKTGRPSRQFVSVTVIGEGNNAEVDGVATALGTVDSKAKAYKIINRFPHLGVVLVTAKKEILVNQVFLNRATNRRWPLGKASFKIIPQQKKKKS